MIKLKDGDTLEFYVDHMGHHRWLVTASNGENIAVATEGYSSRQGARDNFERNGYNLNQVKD